MKIYLSRSTTRSMMADYPIGDPTGGPAYGEKRDPISAVISIASMAGTYATAAAALTAAGGVASFGSVIASMSLMQGLTFAGAALSLIGNVTGNKALSNIGMIAGLAGGVGMFADSVMGGAPTGGTLGEAFDSGKRALSGSNVSLAEVYTPVVDGMQAVDAAKGLDAANSSVGLANKLPDAPTLAAPAGAPAPAAVNLAITPGSGAAAIGVPEVNPAGLGLKPPIDYSPMSKGTGLKLPNSTGLPPSVMDLVKEGKFGDAAMTAGGKAMDFASSSPYGAYVAAQAIGAGAEYLSGLSDAKLDELKASTGYANARTSQLQADMDREKAKRANINASYANVDAGIKVKQPGLVAGAMKST